MRLLEHANRYSKEKVFDCYKRTCQNDYWDYDSMTRKEMLERMIETYTPEYLVSICTTWELKALRRLLRNQDLEDDRYRFEKHALSSKFLEQAQHFANDFSVEHLFTSLEAMAESDAIDAVYIASPNSLHFSQTQLFLSHKINVICEKPLASNLAEVDAAIACARENQVVLFEAFKTACLPNFHLLRQALPKVGKLRKVFFNYCQYSSRYQRYLDGENPNTFNPAFSNGSIMDIGFYCLASAVALFGEPKSVQATASLLASGVDAQGVVVMDYGDFSVTLQHSKVSDSVLASEIQGEAGSLVIEKLSECQKVCFVPRGSQMQDLTQPQHINTMLYEAELFATLVDEHLVDHPGLAVSRITAKLLTEIRRQTGVIFPADSVKL